MSRAPPLLRRLIADSGCCSAYRVGLSIFTAATFAAWTTEVRSQSLDLYFPTGVSGYDQQLGVTVLSRLRPGYETPGIRAGGFLIRPDADVSTFYNSNVNGVPGSASSGSRATGSVSAASDWDRDSLGASVGVDHYQFFSLPGESYTDWNVGAVGGYTIDESQLTLAYYHSSYHQLGTGIATVQSVTPVSDSTDSARLSYTFTFSRLTVTPDISFGAYRYGTASVLGTPVNLGFLDRNAFAGGVTNRYSLSDEGGVLVVLRGVSSQYTAQQPGAPNNDSTSFLLLAGLDYQAKSVWRYRLLVGVEVREFADNQFATRTAPIAEGSVIWQPTGLTTVTGSLSRQIEDPQSAGTNGYVLTQARLAVDHELRRDIILQARVGAQYAQYLQGGAQTNVTTGLSANWLMNRNMRLSFDCDFTKQIGSNSSSTTNNPTTLTSGAYNQNIVALRLHLAL